MRTFWFFYHSDVHTFWQTFAPKTFQKYFHLFSNEMDRPSLVLLSEIKEFRLIKSVSRWAFLANTLGLCISIHFSKGIAVSVIVSRGVAIDINSFICDTLSIFIVSSFFSSFELSSSLLNHSTFLVVNSPFLVKIYPSQAKRGKSFEILIFIASHNVWRQCAHLSRLTLPTVL